MSPSYILSQFILKILESLDSGLVKSDLDFFSVEAPRDASHGDLATNVAMILAKKIGISPQACAQTIAEKLLDHDDILKAEVAGPGFINITLHDDFWHKTLADILEKGHDFGRSSLGKQKKINIEYVSANPTGPMHIGHCRGAVVGDVLANILTFTGYDVSREYYINDAGRQIDILARSVFLRYRQALGETISEIPSGLYPGDYLIPVGKRLVSLFGKSLLEKPESEALAKIQEHAVAIIMEDIKIDLDCLGVHHDVFFSEKSLYAEEAKAVHESFAVLKQAGALYEGKLDSPKGKKAENEEKEEEQICEQEDAKQLLFRSSTMGDDSDRVLVKSDGSFTYFASDVAYLHNKIKRGFTNLIFILGADHAGYVERIKAIARCLTKKNIELTVLLCNLVHLSRDGNPVRMSKRSGDFITLRNVVEEVGRDAVRFMMLYRKNDAPLDFDFSKVVEQTKDNPVFYVQYACARCHSVFRQIQEECPDMNLDRQSLQAYVSLLAEKEEIALIRNLSEYPALLKSIAHSQEPHRLAFYLYNLASDFHAHWNRGIKNSNLRFIKLNALEQTKARLGLVQAVCDVLTSGLSLIGASAPKQMS